MLSPSAVSFLKRLLDAPAPSGFEAVAARAWRAEAETFADKVSSDVAGNSIAEVTPGGSPTIMLDGHIDEIGVIVQYIDDDGYVYIAPIGGWDPQVLVGQRIRFLGNAGDVIGVVGKKPIHLMKSEDREHASKFSDLWVDIGAAKRAEAESRLSIGDPGVIDSRSHDFPNDRIVSRSIDDRIGAFIVLEALRRYAEKPGAARVVAAATTQEEIAWHGGGALVCAHSVNPQIAIVVDVTFATDHPNIEKKEIGEHKMGGGPIISRGALISPVVHTMLRDAAKKLEMPHAVHAVGRDTSTNADAIHIAREGVATGLVSIPNRYMHSPNEMVDLKDVDAAAALLAEFCRSVTAKTDLTAR
ncbi:MAG TPA: M20/M25/M40 family metallo-hydrolase [Gemmatimonadaceae bacterium]|nr:M20/M25/M40 family metallo-hydrolase [Gemmatimonadaceae bacterium]